MPELPEVEVVRRGLERFVVDSDIERVRVLHPRSVRRHLAGVADFEDQLSGERVVAARRRGKYLWLALASGDAVLGHLGMSGQLLVQPSDAGPPRHLRVQLELSGGRELRFVDQRMFGGLLLARGGAELPLEIAHIARDPLDELFDEARFFGAVRGRHTGIKRALLDQTLISGVGNIYADEALWAARLHYARPTETLRRREVDRLLAEVRAVMLAALDAGGTSFDALYVNVNGESGYFDRSLSAYGQADKPCPRCGTPIRRDPFMNRSSYSCPRCQPQPRRARW
ncbi:MAG: bifunctional DNA-formamidopyrimidine glycosylase/DNA-(apurinic or apyrimidinic site) lyase [Nocardioidaceae bacterium]|nr:bifunctional DNA-formamidopyrimidine glycosylase/DNA-(apurinic or apyrimidinic site) lyase [Nocardioidaceae bacterium]